MGQRNSFPIPFSEKIKEIAGNIIKIENKSIK